MYMHINAMRAPDWVELTCDEAEGICGGTVAMVGTFTTVMPPVLPIRYFYFGCDILGR